MATQNPQRIELGQTLQGMREKAGLSPRDVESDLRWYKGKCKRTESGVRVPTFAEVDRLAGLYRITDEERATLHLMADAARRRESAAHVADFAQTYITIERQAAEIDYYDPELIVAMCQNEQHARAVLATGSGQVDERVADRLARGLILTRPNAPRVRVILGEAALHRMVGGPAAMRAQIEHLLRLTELPNVSIRILPFAVGAHRALGVGFTLLRVRSPEIVRVYIEGLTDATYIHEPDETGIYERVFAQLWEEVAAGDDESATILRRHITTEEHHGGKTLETIDSE